MGKEKFLLRRRERTCFAHDRTQRGCHLERDQQKDDHPNLETAAALGAEVRESIVEESQAEIGRDQPKDQVKRAHRRD